MEDLMESEVLKFVLTVDAEVIKADAESKAEEDEG